MLALKLRKKAKSGQRSGLGQLTVAPRKFSFDPRRYVAFRKIFLDFLKNGNGMECLEIYVFDDRGVACRLSDLYPRAARRFLLPGKKESERTEG